VLTVKNCGNEIGKQKEVKFQGGLYNVYTGDGSGFISIFDERGIKKV